MSRKKSDKSQLDVRFPICWRLLHYWETKGWTQEEFAKKVGLSRSAISEIANQKHNVKADKLALIIQRTDISAEWLFTGEGDMYARESRSPPFEWPPEIDPYMRRTAEVLTSGTKTAKALMSNIDEFWEKVQMHKAQAGRQAPGAGKEDGATDEGQSGAGGRPGASGRKAM